MIKFPPPLLDSPNSPLKLEAGLRLGAYFNAALQVSSDPKDLLPSAGAFLGFYGRLSVMCVSLSVATVYAVGQVTLDIAADSRVGPTLHMKFGFGAQIVIGLPRSLETSAFSTWSASKFIPTRSSLTFPRSSFTKDRPS